MVNNSQSFLYEITKTQRNLMQVSGYFTKQDSTVVSFNEDNIAIGTLSISKKSVSKNYFNIGEAYIDMAKITLNIDDDNDWKGLVNSELTLSFSILDDDSNELLCALGKWDILSDGVTRKLSSVSFTGDSFLNRLDVSMEVQTNGTPYELVYYACEECGVPFRMVEADFSSFINSEFVYYVSDLSKIKTFRDLVMWASQIVAGYCTVDMDGYLVIRTYIDSTTFEPNQDTIASSEVGDYTYQLTGLMMTLDGDIYSSGIIGQGNYIELDSNPLLLSGTPDFKQIVINNLYSVLSLISFKTFSITYNGNPSLECGDTLIISDRELSCPVQSSEWKYRGKSKILGYLPDTASDVSNQTVKNSTTTSGSTGSKLTVSRYKNSSEIVVGQVYQQVASISFATPDISTPMMLFSMVAVMSEETIVRLRFTYDNVVQDFDPRYSLNAGYFTFDISKALSEAVAGSDHVLIVEVLCDSGSVTVDIDDCELAIYGYGVESEGGNFNGFITLSEVFRGLDGVTGKSYIGGFTESVSVVLT